MQTHFPEIANKVKESTSYIDRVDLWIAVVPSESDEAILASFGAYEVRDIEKMDFIGPYKKRLCLFQPNFEVLAWLQERLSNRVAYCFNKLEIALDVFCENRCDTNEVRNFIDLHLIQLWRRNSFRTIYVDTTYYKEGSAKNNIAIYKRNSKLTGNYCCHVERRIIMSAAIKAKGIRKISDLINLNHYVNSICKCNS